MSMQSEEDSGATLDYGSSDPEEDRPEIGACPGVGTALEASSPFSIPRPAPVPFSHGRMHRSASPIGRDRPLPRGAQQQTLAPARLHLTRLRHARLHPRVEDLLLISMLPPVSSMDPLRCHLLQQLMWMLFKLDSKKASNIQIFVKMVQ
jgi:hypothetical protein